jgi:hypothetical protein
MAASVSDVERFERAGFESGRDGAAAGNDWNFKEVLRMDHLNVEEPTRDQSIRFN